MATTTLTAISFSSRDNNNNNNSPNATTRPAYTPSSSHLGSYENPSSSSILNKSDITLVSNSNNSHIFDTHIHEKSASFYQSSPSSVSTIYSNKPLGNPSGSDLTYSSNYSSTYSCSSPTIITNSTLPISLLQANRRTSLKFSSIKTIKRKSSSLLKHRNSLHSTVSQSSSSSGSSSSSSLPVSAVPALPPIVVPEHYSDLTHLFDSADPEDSNGTAQNSSNKNNNSNSESTKNLNDSKKSQQEMDGLRISQFDPRQQSPSPGQTDQNPLNQGNKSSNNASSALDLPEYSIYTSLGDNDSDDDNSIQNSPVNGKTDLAYSLGTNINKNINNSNSNLNSHVRTSPSFGQQNTSPLSEHTTSPNLRQTDFQSTSPNSSILRSPSLSYEPVNRSLSNNGNNRLSTVAKVKSMFPGFANYKSLSKNSPSPHNSPQSEYESNGSNGGNPYNSNFSNGSALSFVEDESQYSQQNQDESLPFSTGKRMPHFHEIDLGPTYKAKVIPVKPSNSMKSIASNSTNNISKTKISSEKDQLLHQHQQAEENGELLDFVPNLRPAIDPVGSRLRTYGVPSPASLMMTKSQYDNYLKQKNDKKGKSKSNSNDNNELNDDDEDDDDDDDEDDDDDDDDDDDEFRRTKRLEEDEERKKQIIRMRLRQDAHLSVYRQKMTKLTGSQIGLSSVGNFGVGSSSQLLNSGGFDSDDSEDDEYDDVPLGILKAHGFPTSANNGRLKTMRSQPNLTNMSNNASSSALLSSADVTTPNHSSTHLLRPLGDSSSVRSFGSPGRSNTPAPEEGFLAMRNPTALPPVFGASNMGMGRGLIGEIAREEEAKLRRKSMMNTLAKERTNTLVDQIDRSSVYNATMNGGAEPLAAPAAAGASSEISAQLSQMMQLQTQILQQMQIQQQPQPMAGMPSTSPMAMGSTATFMTPMQPGANSQFPQKNWNNYDMSMMRSTPGAPSIRSYTPSIHGSVNSGYEGNYASNSTTNFNAAANNRMSRHQHTASVPSLGTNAFKFPNKVGGQPSQGPSTANPQSPNSIKLINPLLNQNNDDDEDDEDEAGWKEMEQKRKQFRSMWKSPSSSPALVS